MKTKIGILILLSILALSLSGRVAYSEPVIDLVENQVYEGQGIDIYEPDQTYRNVMIKDYRYQNVAAGIHASENATNALVDRFWIYNCDRGVEIEDGASNITVEHGYIEGVSYLYSIGAHNHGRASVTNIRYNDITIVDSRGFSVTTWKTGDQVSFIYLNGITVINPSGRNRLSAPYSYLSYSNIDSPTSSYGGISHCFMAGHPLAPFYIDHTVFRNLNGEYGFMQANYSKGFINDSQFLSNGNCHYGLHIPAMAELTLVNVDFSGLEWVSVRNGGKLTMINCSGDKKVLLEESSHDSLIIGCDFPNIIDRGTNNTIIP